MITIHIENNRSIELSKSQKGALIDVDVIDSNGEMEYCYVITVVEMVTLLNQFERENNIS